MPGPLGASSLPPLLCLLLALPLTHSHTPLSVDAGAVRVANLESPVEGRSESDEHGLSHLGLEGNAAESTTGRNSTGARVSAQAAGGGAGGRVSARRGRRKAAYTCPPVRLIPNDVQLGSINPANVFQMCQLTGNEGTTTPFPIRVSLRGVGLRWQGWGTSLSNNARFIGSLATGARKCVSNLMFDRTRGLGLNIVRYNIPGGYNPRFSPDLAQHRWSSRGFWPTSASSRIPLRWSPLARTADLAQELVLRDAKARGANLFEAIAYSPPWWMTHSYDTEGARHEHMTNLRPQFHGLYAKYLSEVVKFVEARAGIRFDAVVPFNEPMEGWWVSNEHSKGVSTEGCNFSPKEINSFLPTLRQELGPKRRIAGVDSWYQKTAFSLDYPGRRSNKELLSRKTISILGRFDVHGYDAKRTNSPDTLFRRMTELRRLAEFYKKPIWQTESGPLRIRDGTDLELAMMMGRRIIGDINIMGARAWLIWQAAQPLNLAWGAIRYFQRRPLKSLFLSRQFYVMLHFTRLVVPGSAILPMRKACAHTVLATYHRPTQRLVLTLVNQGDRGRRLQFSLKGFACARGPCLVQLWRTSGREMFRGLRKTLRWSGLSSIYVGPSSILSLVVLSAVPQR